MSEAKMVEKSKAISAAVDYCKSNGLSVSKLKGLHSQYLLSSFVFAAFPNGDADGLKNDIETRARPVLFIRPGYVVEETAITRDIL